MLMGHVLHMDFKNRIEWHHGVGFKLWAGFNNTIANTLAFILKDVNMGVLHWTECEELQCDFN